MVLYLHTINGNLMSDIDTRLGLHVSFPCLFKAFLDACHMERVCLNHLFREVLCQAYYLSVAMRLAYKI